MMRILGAGLLFCFSLLAAPEGDLNAPRLNVGPFALYLKDPKGALTAEAVAALPDDAFRRIDAEAIGFGFTSAVYWFRFTLSNPAAAPAKRLLSFEPTWLDHIEGWVFGPSGEVWNFHGGDCRECACRTFRHPKNVFEPVLEPGQSTFVIRVETRDPFVVAMTLWEERAFFAADADDRLYMGFIYGVLIAMIIYNLFLFAAIRDRIYGFYALYVASFITMNFTYSGYSFFYLWPDAPEWGNWAHSLFIYLFTLTGPLFATIFLNTKTKHPRLHRAVGIYALLVVLIALLSAGAGGYGPNVAASIFLVVLFSVLMFTMGIVAWTGGNKAARFFIAGTSAGLIGAAITALTVSGLLPFSFLTYRAADIGMILDAMFLSMALADRYKTLKAESDHLKIKDAKQEAIILKQHQQAVLGGLIGVIAHQMKQPLSVISLAIQSLSEGARLGDLQPGEIEKTEKTILSNVDFMSQTVDQFRNYHRPDKTKKPFALAPMLESTLSLLNEPLRTRKIDVRLRCEPSLTLTTYENELQQVILNLLSNAIEALVEGKTPNPAISVTAVSAEGKVVIVVEDNGGGLPPEALGHLFELFYTTKGEKGTGIGLYLCKSIVTESLGGAINARNTAKGARFEMILPLG